jgi:hypothetical protein
MPNPTPVTTLTSLQATITEAIKELQANAAAAAQLPITTAALATANTEISALITAVQGLDNAEAAPIVGP